MVLCPTPLLPWACTPSPLVSFDGGGAACIPNGLGPFRILVLLLRFLGGDATEVSKGLCCLTVVAPSSCTPCGCWVAAGVHGVNSVTQAMPGHWSDAGSCVAGRQCIMHHGDIATRVNSARPTQGCTAVVQLVAAERQDKQEGSLARVNQPGQHVHSMVRCGAASQQRTACCLKAGALGGVWGGAACLRARAGHCSSPRGTHLAK